MAQDHHRVFRVHGKPLQQRRRRVAQIVKPDRAHTGSLYKAMKRTSQVARFDRPTTSSGEDQPFPAPLVRAVAENLMALVLDERVPGDAEEWQLADARAGLDRAKVELPADPNDLAAHVDHALVVVDVVPAKTEHLATPQPIDQQENERGIERITTGCLQELARFTW